MPGIGGRDVYEVKCLSETLHREGHTTPWAIMARATFMKPATLAPRT